MSESEAPYIVSKSKPEGESVGRQSPEDRPKRPEGKPKSHEGVPKVLRRFRRLPASIIVGPAGLEGAGKANIKSHPNETLKENLNINKLSPK